MTLLAILLLQAASTTAPAQAPAATTGVSAPALCLTRDVVDADGRSQPFLIVVRPAEATDLLAGGFEVATCAMTKVDAARYRDIVCKVAAAPNEAVQNRYAALFGVRAKTLCDAATALGSGLAAILGGGK